MYYLVVALSNVVVLVVPYVMKPKHFEFDRPSAAFMASLNPGRLRLIQVEGLAVVLLTRQSSGCCTFPSGTIWRCASFGVTWSASYGMCITTAPSAM